MTAMSIKKPDCPKPGQLRHSPRLCSQSEAVGDVTPGYWASMGCRRDRCPRGTWPPQILTGRKPARIPCRTGDGSSSENMEL